MNIRTLASRAARLRAGLATLPTPEALALGARTADAGGPYGKAARDLHGLRGQLNALYADHDETYTLYRTADGRVFERLGEADEHGVHRDERSLEVLTVRVVKVRRCVDVHDGADGQTASASGRVTE